MLDEWQKNWTDSIGLTSLDPKWEGPYVTNDNGILFSAYALYLLREDVSCLLDLYHECVLKLQVEPGLFRRKPIGVPSIPEAHDNFVGICAISVLFEFAFAREIVEYGTRTGFCYNSENPGVFDLKYVRQGGDIAFYKICAGMKPTIWEYTWLLCGLLVTILKGSASTKNLGWLRCQAMMRKSKPLLVSLIAPLLGKSSFKNYFRAEHPITKLAEMVQ